jgi:glutamate-1-semialdehyde 2,1-aminomutase
MKIGILVTARMGSTRLPNKHFYPIAQRPALAWLLKRVCDEFSLEITQGKSEVLIATGSEFENTPFCNFAEEFPVKVFFGDDNNVPLRHLQVAKNLGFDSLLSIDGDDIFCAPEAMRKVYEALASGAHFAKTDGLPLGMNAWGYSKEYLALSLTDCDLTVLETGWGRIFSTVDAIAINMDCPGSEFIRATMDYPEDAEFFDSIACQIPGWDKLTIFELVHRILCDSLQDINSGLNEKYWENFNMEISKEKKNLIADRNYSERLNAVIPGGAHTYSRGDDQFPSNAPQILESGEGAYVIDPNGKKFLDYGMALRAVTLGYAYPSVNEAAIREISHGNNLTRASLTELKAAELITDLIPSIDMVKFGKNGSNATTAAVKIARAFNGRRFVCIPRQQPFFSFDDWFIGKTPLTSGIPDENASATLFFDYGNIRTLERHFAEHPGEIAAVMLEPATTLTPCSSTCSRELTYTPNCSECPNREENFLHKVQKLCRANDTVFILDEMITGFRWHLQGAQTYFGVSPDLTTFGKGMANGFSVAAVGGRREIMEVGAINTPGLERTFLLSTTHGGEMSGLGAFIETVDVYKNKAVCEHLWKYGERLKKGIQEIARMHSVESYFLIEGPSISLNYVTKNLQGEISLPLRTLFSQEMIRNGVLMPWIAISLAHGDEELEITLRAVDMALAVYKKALFEGVENFLEGPSIKPVFRKYN